jgi:two-component system response regulator HupR/HoxA
VNYYIDHYSKKFGHSDIQISPQAIDLLMVNDWPGNVRQLCNEIQRMVASAEDGTLITPDQLSPELKRTSSTFVPGIASQNLIARTEEQTGSLADAVSALEQRMIHDALQKHSGNITRAARELGMTRRGLQLKLGRYRDSDSDQ